MYHCVDDIMIMAVATADDDDDDDGPLPRFARRRSQEKRAVLYTKNIFDENYFSRNVFYPKYHNNIILIEDI